MNPRAHILFFLCVALQAPGQVIPDPTQTVILTSAPPYSATGELFILLADTNAPALNNPVLVVEGFDIENSMNWPELYDLLNQENLIGDLQAFGRDLIVLNFTDSTIDILANAALVETAVDYINTNRSTFTDKFTVVGASLGGLASRKALVDLPNHEVDVWISFDAPHEGANIPLGIQEYLEFFADYNESAAGLLAALDSPASRQLLLVHHTYPDGLAAGSQPERLDFVTAMNMTGYPTNCKTIAISNGSGYGEKLPFNPTNSVIHWQHDGGGFLNPDITSDIYRLKQSTNSASIVFHGDIDVFLFGRPETTVNSYYPLSIDDAPGGYRSTFVQLYTNLPYIDDGNDHLTATNHCFIPTVSALGIPIENIESNLAANADLLALSPFDEIHYAIDNEPHVEINTRNKRWVMRAVLEDRDTDGDGYDDYEEYLLGTAYDSADSLPGIYAIIEVVLVDSRAALTWNAYPNMQYEVWFAAELGDPWQPLETVSPTTDADITREYLIDTEATAGFFKIGAAPVDPVTD